MWTAVNEQFRTKSKKPDNPPAVDVGSFLKQSTYNTSATWFIIYWKGLEEYEKNADGLSYVLTKALKNGKEVYVSQRYSIQQEIIISTTFAGIYNLKKTHPIQRNSCWTRKLITSLPCTVVM